MSLIHIDGFDNVATATLSAKGWTVGGGNPTIQTGTKRNGTQALSGNNRNAYLQRGVAPAEENDTFIVGFAFQIQSLPGSEDTCLAVFASDGGGTDHTSISVTPALAIRVFRGNSTGTQLATTSAAAIAVGTWYYIEFKAKLHDTTGTVDVHLNTTSIISLTGQDTKNGGTKTVYDSIRIGASADGRASPVCYFDDFYLCNAAGSANNGFLGDVKVDTIYPNGNGNSSQMLGSDADSVNNYLLVNAALPQTTTYVGTTTLNNEDTYAHGDIAAGQTVFGVQAMAYATKLDAGARSLALVTRSAGTDYAGSDVALPTGANTFVKSLREQDPATSAAWTASGVNAAEFGPKAR